MYTLSLSLNIYIASYYLIHKSVFHGSTKGALARHTDNFNILYCNVTSECRPSRGGALGICCYGKSPDMLPFFKRKIMKN